MSNNIPTNPGSGGATIKSDEISNLHYQQIKIAYGDEGVAIGVSDLTPFPVDARLGDTPSVDAYGRLRVSNPETQFDSKQIFDNQPLIWDDAEESGSGTTSTHDVNQASSVIGVGATTAGKRTRQTFMRINYQPGKSQLVMMSGTLVISGGGAGITASFGCFDDNNGIFLRHKDGVTAVVLRSKASGSAVDTVIDQSSWNLDKFDGTGNSGVTLNTAKSQILVIDFEWLSIGRVRIGFIIGGRKIYVHEFLHSNITEGVYMSTPNLPLRYQIENDGTGVVSTMRHMCATVISEGGSTDLGVLRHVGTDGVHVDANVAGTLYAVIGIRLKSTALGGIVNLSSVSLISKTNDDFEWEILLNPSVAGTFTYVDESNSVVQIAKGATANEVTGGTKFEGSVAKQNVQSEVNTPNAIRLGSAINGTVDTIVLAVRPFGTNADIEATITRRELN